MLVVKTAWKKTQIFPSPFYMYFLHMQLALRAALVLKITFVFWAIKRRPIYILTTTIYIFLHQDTSVFLLMSLKDFDYCNSLFASFPKEL